MHLISTIFFTEKVGTLEVRHKFCRGHFCFFKIMPTLIKIFLIKREMAQIKKKEIFKKKGEKRQLMLSFGSTDNLLSKGLAK